MRSATEAVLSAPLVLRAAADLIGGHTATAETATTSTAATDDPATAAVVRSMANGLDAAVTRGWRADPLDPRRRRGGRP